MVSVLLADKKWARYHTLDWRIGSLGQLAYKSGRDLSYLRFVRHRPRASERFTSMRTTIFSVTSAGLAGALLVAAVASAQQGRTTATQREPGALAQAPAAAQPVRQLGSTPEEKAVLDGIMSFAKIYETANAAALADLFLDEAMIVDPDGYATRGKAAVAAMYEAAFKDNPGLKLESKVEAIRFLTPDLVRVEGKARIAVTHGDAAEFTGFTTLLARREGKWRIAEIHEYAAPAEAVTSYERLKELEWMVGDWVDESDNSRSQSSVRWADNQSFLIRTFSIHREGEKPSTGTMFIGWDPQSGQIKSWLFNSEGGHGEGLWTRTDEKEWVIKASGVLRDGRPTSATQIQTMINKDSVKVSSIDRIIGGVVAPDIVDVVMVRKAPPPGGAAPKPGAAAEAPR